VAVRGWLAYDLFSSGERCRRVVPADHPDVPLLWNGPRR
jgi:hypothetical protein